MGRGLALSSARPGVLLGDLLVDGFDEGVIGRSASVTADSEGISGIVGSSRIGSFSMSMVGL